MYEDLALMMMVKKWSIGAYEVVATGFANVVISNAFKAINISQLIKSGHPLGVTACL